MEKLTEFMMKKQDLMYSISEHFLVFIIVSTTVVIFICGRYYFSIQTYRQEVADHFNELDEDNRRFVVRGDIKQWNQMLAETAHNAGVITNEEFAIFQNAGYMGLYGGLDVEGILAAVYQSVFGGDVYLSLEEKVANLLFNEIGNSQVV